MKTLLAVTAAGEATMGLALLVDPSLVVRLLFGGEIVGAGTALGRVGGFALLSLGLACWPGRAGTEGKSRVQAVQAMLAYNLLITIYLVYLGAAGQFAGILLWPAVVLHAVLALLFARDWWFVKF